MSVKYTLALRGNPGDTSVEKKYYAQATSVGEINLKRLSSEISSSSVLSESDVLMVLNKLAKTVNQHLSKGRIVRFDNFGSFCISLKSDGVEKPEEFDTILLRSAKVIFRPNPDTKKMLNNLEFEKI